MKALIAPNQPVVTGYRVAEVSEHGFDVAEPLFWVECSEAVQADLFFYDNVDESIKPVPAPPEPPVMDEQIP